MLFQQRLEDEIEIHGFGFPTVYDYRQLMFSGVINPRCDRLEMVLFINLDRGFGIEHALTDLEHFFRKAAIFFQ